MSDYIGRFAPTPSGPLHFGSILAALASFLDARSQAGRWFVRMDDLDTPRVKPEVDTQILRTLEALGLQWDGEILYQSKRREAYESALQTLISKNILYACICTRKQTKGRVYPGTCRNKVLSPDERHSLRILAPDKDFSTNDHVQGSITQQLASDVGDFVIQRNDGIHAYHLAVVVDDDFQGVNHIVRGADLADSTPRQLFLYELLSFPLPEYAHIPVALDKGRKKISKQLFAEDVLLQDQPAAIIYSCLLFLGQNPEPELVRANVGEILSWAISHWQMHQVPGVISAQAPESFSAS